MELLPTVYEVKFHFFKKQLPKLPNGKYDGMTLIKSISEGGESTTGDDMMTVDITTENVSKEPQQDIQSPYSELTNEISNDL